MFQKGVLNLIIFSPGLVAEKPQHEHYILIDMIVIDF